MKTEKYTAPKSEITEFATIDVITTSNGGSNGGYNDNKTEIEGDFENIY